MTTPRTWGRLPFQRMRPALPQLMLVCSALPTSPMVARQRASTLRISPDGMRSCAYGPSLATSCTEAQLDGVPHGAQRDVPQRQVVAGLDVRTRTVLDEVALTQLGRREDVALLAVQVVQQRDARGAVGVVLDVGDLGPHAVLVVAA